MIKQTGTSIPWNTVSAIKKGWITDTHHNSDGTQGHYADGKQPITKVIYDMILFI